MQRARSVGLCKIQVGSFSFKNNAQEVECPWQRQICQTYGNNNMLAMDSTFGTNQYKMALYTIMVFDSHKNGILIAWIVRSSSKRLDIIAWLKASRNVMLDNFKSWSPNAFIIDDAELEMGAIRYIPINP